MVLLNSSFKSRNKDSLSDPFDCFNLCRIYRSILPSSLFLRFLTDRSVVEASPPTNVASAEAKCELKKMCLSSITLLVTKSSTAERRRSLGKSFNQTKASCNLSFALCLFPYSKVLLRKTWRSSVSNFNSRQKNRKHDDVMLWIWWNYRYPRAH